MAEQLAKSNFGVVDRNSSDSDSSEEEEEDDGPDVFADDMALGEEASTASTVATAASKFDKNTNQTSTSSHSKINLLRRKSVEIKNIILMKGPTKKTGQNRKK